MSDLEFKHRKHFTIPAPDDNKLMAMRTGRAVACWYGDVLVIINPDFPPLAAKFVEIPFERVEGSGGIIVDPANLPGGDSASIEKIRQAVADYMESEGCGCCSNAEVHEKHKEALGKMLRVEKYPDGSGYDFGKYRGKK